MAKGDQGIALRHLSTLFCVGAVGGLTDAQLLEQFTTRRDESAELAFEALVERHGPMVLRTCRSVLRDPHDVDDAFQATFLVLVRRAGSLWVRDSLGPWLHQVAHRTASCARSAAARRRRHERLAAASAADLDDGPDGDDLGALLHEEVSRLPGRYRPAVVLCLLEGLTPEQAARHLSCPVGTVHSRLARGRERLRARLTRRGLAPAAWLPLAMLSAEATQSAIPISLVVSTVRAATRFAAVKMAARAVTAPVAELTEGVLRMMFLTRLKLMAVFLLATGVLATGVGLLAGQRTEGNKQAEKVAGQSRSEAQLGSDKSPTLPARVEGKDEEDTKEKLIDGLLARSTAIASGRIEYHVKVDIAGRTLTDSDYRFSYSGESWATRNPQSNHAIVNHEGRLLSYSEALQRDGAVHRSLTIGFSESPFKNPPYPPVRAGTLWSSSTRRFVREQASRARFLGAETVNGVGTRALEWDVDPKDKYLAFHAINDLLSDGGKLRLYVARQLGYALPRIEHVDKFGTVQDQFDFSDFREVAPEIHVPAICRLGRGNFEQKYHLTKIEKVNESIPNNDFVLSIPAGTSVGDNRPKMKDKVDPDGKRTFSLRDYPLRQFRTGAPYPQGFPAGLLKELDREVVKPVVKPEEH